MCTKRLPEVKVTLICLLPGQLSHTIAIRLPECAVKEKLTYASVHLHTLILKTARQTVLVEH
jgi:hypothetical protein